MKISKIRIKNYRGIKNSRWIEFDRLNAIVGKMMRVNHLFYML